MLKLLDIKKVSSFFQTLRYLVDFAIIPILLGQHPIVSSCPTIGGRWLWPTPGKPYGAQFHQEHVCARIKMDFFFKKCFSYFTILMNISLTETFF